MSGKKLLLIIFISGISLPQAFSFVLKDGIYFSFEDVKQNQPNLEKKNLFKSYYDTVFTIYQWAHTANLYYIDDSGAKVSLSRDSIWGFSEGGTQYFMRGGYFHKISLFGSISVFTEFYSTIRDPMAVVITDKKGISTDRIIDMEEQLVINYDVDNVAFVLSRDAELFSQFNALTSKKQKKKRLYSFIEKYNERNPLFNL